MTDEHTAYANYHLELVTHAALTTQVDYLMYLDLYINCHVISQTLSPRVY